MSETTDDQRLEAIEAFVPVNENGKLDLDFLDESLVAATTYARGRPVWRVRVEPLDLASNGWQDDFTRILMGNT